MYNNFSPYQSFGNTGAYNPYLTQTPQQTLSQNMRDPYSGAQILNQNTNLIFVESLEEVKSYNINPNCTYLFMDSKNKRFYVKSTDNLGISNITRYSFDEITNKTDDSGEDSPNPAKSFSVGEEEYNSLVAKIRELEEFKASVETKLDDLI